MVKLNWVWVWQIHKTKKQAELSWAKLRKAQFSLVWLRISIVNLFWSLYLTAGVIFVCLWRVLGWCPCARFIAVKLLSKKCSCEAVLKKKILKILVREL